MTHLDRPGRQRAQKAAVDSWMEPNSRPNSEMRCAHHIGQLYLRPQEVLARCDEAVCAPLMQLLQGLAALLTWLSI